MKNIISKKIVFRCSAGKRKSKVVHVRTRYDGDRYQVFQPTWNGDKVTDMVDSAYTHFSAAVSRAVELSAY